MHSSRNQGTTNKSLIKVQARSRRRFIQKYKRLIISLALVMVLGFAWTLVLAEPRMLASAHDRESPATKFHDTSSEHNASFRGFQSSQASNHQFLATITQDSAPEAISLFTIVDAPIVIPLTSTRVPHSFNVTMVGVPRHVLAVMEVQMTIQLNDSEVVPDRLSLEATTYPSYRLEPLTITDALELSPNDLKIPSRQYYFSLPTTVTAENHAEVDGVPDVYRMDMSVTLAVERVGIKKLSGTWTLERVTVAFYPEAMVLQENDVGIDQESSGGDITEALDGFTVSLSLPFNVSMDLLPVVGGLDFIEGALLNLPKQELVLPITIPIASNLLKYVDYFNVTLMGTSTMHFASSEIIEKAGSLQARVRAGMGVSSPSTDDSVSYPKSSPLITNVSGISSLTLPFNTPSLFSVSFIVPKEVFQFLFLQQDGAEGSTSFVDLTGGLNADSEASSSPTLQLYVVLDQLVLQLPTTTDADDRLTIEMLVLELSQLSLSFTVGATSLLGRFSDPDVLPYSLLLLVMFLSMTMAVSINVITRRIKIIALDQLKNTLTRHVERYLP